MVLKWATIALVVAMGVIYFTMKGNITDGPISLNASYDYIIGKCWILGRHLTERILRLKVNAEMRGPNHTEHILQQRHRCIPSRHVVLNER